MAILDFLRANPELKIHGIIFALRPASALLNPPEQVAMLRHDMRRGIQSRPSLHLLQHAHAQPVVFKFF